MSEEKLKEIAVLCAGAALLLFIAVLLSRPPAWLLSFNNAFLQSSQVAAVVLSNQGSIATNGTTTISWEAPGTIANSCSLVAAPAPSGGGTTNADLWTAAGSLPANTPVGYSMPVLVGNSIYRFGGYTGTAFSNAIMSAPVSNPSSWTQVGTLPSARGGAAVAVIGGYIYIFGGTGDGATSDGAILRASIASPGVWTQVGTLPAGAPMAFQNFAIASDTIYFFGGLGATLSTGVNTVWSASPSSPAAWSQVSGATLPAGAAVAKSGVVLNGGNVYLVGGVTAAGATTASIYSSPLSGFGSWTLAGTLPSAVAEPDAALIGGSIYVMGGFNGSSWSGAVVHNTNADNYNGWTTDSTTAGIGGSGAPIVLGTTLYIFGGAGASGWSNTMYSAPVANSAALWTYAMPAWLTDQSLNAGLTWGLTQNTTYTLSCSASGSSSGSVIFNSPAGTVSTFATVGSPPFALAFDSSGNLYTVNYTFNYSSNTVSKITPSGTVSTFATVGNAPVSLAFDSSGNLYTANYRSNTVSKITPSGTVSTFATTGSEPSSLAFDSSSNLYVSNCGSNTVSKITPSGTVSTFATVGTCPYALAFDSSGNLYAANYMSNTVSKITPSGTVSTFATVGAYPVFLAFDSSGNLYTANYGSYTVSKITPSGTVSTFAVGTRPIGLAIDSSGNVYVANNADNTVSKITPSGTVSTFATVGSEPYGLAFDSSGNLYVANSDDLTISKISGSVWPVPPYNTLTVTVNGAGGGGGGGAYAEREAFGLFTSAGIGGNVGGSSSFNANVVGNGGAGGGGGRGPNVTGSNGSDGGNSQSATLGGGAGGGSPGTGAGSPVGPPGGYGGAGGQAVATYSQGTLPSQVSFVVGTGGTGGPGGGGGAGNGGAGQNGSISITWTGILVTASVTVNVAAPSFLLTACDTAGDSCSNGGAPAVIPPNQGANLAWLATLATFNPNSCSVVQTDPGSLVSAISAMGAGDSMSNFSTPPLTQNGIYTYTLSCTTPSSGNDGTLTAALSSVAGKFGQALQFNSTSGYVATNKALSTFMSASAGTMSMWMYPTAAQNSAFDCTTGDVAGMIDGNNPLDSTGGYVWLGMDKTNICAGGYSGANQDITAPYTINTWTHVVWVHGSGMLYLYVNGSLKGSVALGNVPNLTKTVNIGAGFISSSKLFNGYIDDARIYNRALSASEVSTLYNGGNITAGLTGYWPFDTGSISGTTAYDFSGGIMSTSTSVSVTLADICTDIPGNQPTSPTGCQTPTPNPGTCTPPGFVYDNSQNACIQTPLPTISSFSISRVRKGSPATLSWSITGMSAGVSCTITPASALAGGGAMVWSTQSPWADSTSTAAILQPTAFTLTCGSGIASTTKSASARFVPDVQEI